MTDLPYGRGGSPLQNPDRKRDIKDTKISAIQVTPRLDDGSPVYIERSVITLRVQRRKYLNGVQRLFHQNDTCFFLKQELIPVPQEGEPVVFKRRKPEEGQNYRGYAAG